jgi:opacity protein-like surface antigen
MKKARRCILTACMVVLVSLPLQAHAGIFLDIYGGAVFTGSSKIEVETSYRTVKKDVNYDTYGEFGGRVGYWFNNKPGIGLALDASGFKREGEGLKTEIVTLSPLLFLRMMTQVSSDFPNGRIQPYIGLGPAFFFSQFDTNTGHLSGDIPLLPVNLDEKYSAQSTDIGFDGRLGIKFKFAWNFAILGEYRFTYAEPTYSENLGGFGIDVNSTLQTHHILIGVGWEF